MSRRTVVPTSLIIASRERPEMLRATVASVLAGTALPAELIIVDQSDRPDEALQRMQGEAGCQIRYIWTRLGGLCRANNLGAREAGYEALVFTHDDVDVDPAWLATLYDALRESGPDTVVTGRILAGESGGAGGYAPTLRTSTEPATYRGRIGYDVLKPLNMAMFRSALEAAGWFDERLGPGTPFPGAEDADLGFRLLEAGFTIRYVPKALVYHRAWRTETEYLPLRWAYGVAHGAFYAKHLRRNDLHIARRFVMDTLYRGRRFPGRVLREGRRALGDPVFLVGNVVGAIRWWRRATSPDPAPGAPAAIEGGTTAD